MHHHLSDLVLFETFIAEVVDADIAMKGCQVEQMENKLSWESPLYALSDGLPLVLYQILAPHHEGSTSEEA
jgi:hypothetical protein